MSRIVAFGYTIEVPAASSGHLREDRWYLRSHDAYHGAATWPCETPGQSVTCLLDMRISPIRAMTINDAASISVSLLVSVCDIASPSREQMTCQGVREGADAYPRA
jgi:hypothetical protein